jgi:UDPglucose 6-dehydrogenase
MEAIVKSNDTRKKHIAEMILAKSPKCVGVYRLTMKTGSDNFRSSAIQTIIEILKKENVEIIIYEPTIDAVEFNECKLEKDLKLFKENSDVIIANRIEECLSDVKDKVYTRDIFTRD